MKRFLRSERNEIMFAAILLTIASGLALAPDAYIPMLARAFMLQWAFLFVLLAVLAAVYKKWWLVLSATIASVFVIVQLRDQVMVVHEFSAGQTLKIAHMNLLQPNPGHAEAIERAIESNADLISFQEVSPEWAHALARDLKANYPYRYMEPRTNCYGIALFSKYPFQRVRTIVMRGSPFIEAVVEVNCYPVRLIAMHATSPISYGHFKKRNDQLSAMAEYIDRTSNGRELSTVVIGDLNTVHWDRAYSRFCADSGLRTAVRRNQRTWPSVGPFALIPLDHLLVSDSIDPVHVNTFDIPGSDHRGLLAEIKIHPYAH